MSFKDNYKKEMENIRADGYLKQKVLNKIQREDSKKKSPFTFARVAAVALSLCLVVAVSIPAIKFFTNNKDNCIAKDSLVYSEEDKEEGIVNTDTTEDYSDIYEKVKELDIHARDTENFVYYTENGIVMYDNSVDKGMAVGNAATGVTTDSAGATNGAANTGAALKQDNSDFSETTEQVEGVSEADIVKTDGKYIYSFSRKNHKIRIIKAGKEPIQVATIPADNLNYNQNLYLSGDRLVIVGTYYDTKTAEVDTVAYIYDVSNPQEPQKVTECRQDGDYSDSRLMGDKLYLISNYSVNTNDVAEQNPRTYVPAVYCGAYDGAVPADSIYINPECHSLCYTVLCGFRITDGALLGTQSIMGGTYTVYCSTKNIITVGYSSAEETQITRYEISDGKITLKADGKIDGTLLNQFSIDEHNGYFRFVTTKNKWIEKKDADDIVGYTNLSTNSLYVLDGDLKKVGSIEDLAPDERVYSVRFMGDVAYFVTFRQVDPLFSADLSDPKNPKIIGKLKIPGFSNYLYPFGDGLLLGLGREADEKTGKTGNMKLSMFDISDPSDVSEDAKTEINVYYSDALDNHKATLVDTEKNLIGFDGYTDNGRIYCIYSFENGKFIKKAQIETELSGESLRGLYIGDEFYIVTDNSLTVYDLSSFEPIYELTYK